MHFGASERARVRGTRQASGPSAALRYYAKFVLSDCVVKILRQILGGIGQRVGALRKKKRGAFFFRSAQAGAD